MKAIVTGGAGFLGSALVRQLIKHGDDVVVLDKITYAGRADNIPEGVHHIQHDVVDDLWLPEADLIYHLAAETHVDRSLQDVEPFVRTNVTGTYSMLEQARRKGVRMVHVSTDEVYGEVQEPYRAFESTAFNPGNPYAVTKAAGDMMAHAYFRSFGTDVVVVRPSNCYGPRQYPEKLIPLACRRALNDERIPVYGDGRQVREWMHVDDCARGIIAAARHGVAGEAYNLTAGAGSARRNLELLGQLLAALGKPDSLLEHVEDRPGHDRRYATDGDKAEASLAWVARVSVEDGIESTARWFLQNRPWLEAA